MLQTNISTQERSAPVSVPHWRSRSAGSPQLVETYAASSAVVEMTWIKALWESMTWRSSRPLKTMMPHVIRKENPAHYLLDALDNDLPQDDRKSALEVPIIEEFMRRAMCRPRWCPHNRNAADAVTKFKGANSGPLFALLCAGMYTLKGFQKKPIGRSCNSTTSWNCTTTQSERRQISDGTIFFVHMPSD